MAYNLKNTLKLACEMSGSFYACVVKKTGTDAIILDYFDDSITPKEDIRKLNEAVRNSFSGESNIPDAAFFNDELKSQTALEDFFSMGINYDGTSELIHILFSRIEKNYSNETKSKIKSINAVLGDMINAQSDEFSGIRLRNIILNINIPILLTDKKGHLIFVNPRMMQEFNLSPSIQKDFFISQFAFKLEDGTELAGEKSPFLQVVKRNKSILNLKVKFMAEDGKVHWFRVNSLAVRSINGEVENVLSTFQDVTNIQEIETRIQETTANIESVLYSSNSSGSEYYFISESVEKMFGYKPQEVYERKYLLMKRIEPEYFGNFKDFSRLLQNGKQATTEFKMLDNKNREVYVRNSGLPIIEDGRVVRVVGVISDITEEKEIQDRLEKSEEKFRLLIETANDLIFTLNSSGYFIMVNRNGAESLGYSSEEMIGKHFLEFVSERNKASIAVSFQRILNSERVTSFESEFIDKLGNFVILEIQARPTKTQGDITGMLGIGRDITDRRKDENKLKELNSKLIEANRLVSIERDRAKQKVTVLEELSKLKNEFISNISHELRTPLASIVGFAETISTDRDLPLDMIYEFNEIMFTEGKRLAKLINDILDFSHLEQGEEALQKTQFNIIELLRDLSGVYEKQAQDKGLALAAEIPDAEIIIEADKERIYRALGHIISNAIKFTDKGGRISIITQDFLKEVEVIISDTGIGIPKEEIPKLFEKFTKINRPGSQVPGAGFGLTVVKQIIDLHKGMIQVKSKIDEGTTFIVRLPKKIRELVNA